MLTGRIRRCGHGPFRFCASARLVQEAFGGAFWGQPANL